MDRQSHLAAALNGYRPADPDEAVFRESMLALLAEPGDPFSRTGFAPGHFTASAFVLAAPAPDGPRVLLIHHRRLDRWLQPGGHVEPADADLEAAARREVREETGLDGLVRVHEGPFDLDIHTIPAGGDQPEHLHLDVRFLFRARRCELRPATEVTAAAWVDAAEAARRNPEPAMTRVLRKLPIHPSPHGGES